jgi:YhcH/YjgK/YiaL family protein
MIVGKIKDLSTYKGISTSLDEAIDYVLNTDLLTLEIGKYVVSENVIVNRQRYFGKEFDVCAPETHKKYLDLQIVVKGSEGFGYAHIDNETLKTKEGYNEEKDVEKYTVKDEFIYVLKDGGFAIVFPEDVHRPGIRIDDQEIEKVVIKIKI